MSTDLKTMAITGAKTFAGVWNFSDFWKRSNTFHSYLRFVDAAEKRWGRTDPALRPMQDLRTALIGENARFFKPYIGGDQVWADDYGWCGLASAEASVYLQSIGDEPNAQTYANIARACWEQMMETGYDNSNDATPVPHGCGNISPDRKRNGGGYGTRNTVTNVNLLLLSYRLHKLHGPGRYLDFALSQAAWFGQWFTLNYPSLDNGPYLRTLPGPLSLIHERPMAEKTYVREEYPNWERGWVWTGDQGLLLMGLATILQEGIHPPGFDLRLYQNSFVTLAAGVETLLFGGSDKVLREPPFNSSFGPSYAGDYIGGRGVLLRYASEPLVTQTLGQPLSPQGIGATANAVWDSRDASGVFGSLWNPAGDQAFNARFVQTWGNGEPSITGWQGAAFEGVLQACGLDALTAAIRLETKA
ncbi:hypothetical protein [Massilia sp. YIM B04103]|uniref:hypothetical protein n=1 Tax=Massilia sp. YIM B04103 TaxID=2963106 RepID=UPI00210C0CC2|nr:hypothetical protein [Massilia sp. YIM B04103]